MSARRIEPLLDIARNHEDDIARELAEKNRALSHHEHQLDELKSYADQYAPLVEGTVEPAKLLNHLAFRDRINVALVQQAKAVETSRQHCDLERTRLLLASRDTQVLEKLAASYRKEEDRIERRIEQNQMDELAGRNASLRRQQGRGEE